MKRTIKAILKKAPISGPLYRKFVQTIHEQHNEIIGLHEAVDRLEARNDEWAQEVREMRGDGKPLEILWPVSKKDLIEADFTKPLEEHLHKEHDPPYTFNWVVPPVGQVSGGHAVIFRMIQHLESRGHKCRVYFYDPMQQVSFEQIHENLKSHHPIKAELFYNREDMADCDAIFATGWTTAYTVFNFKGVGKKLYFVQDYEAIFEPSGSYSTLADNTYRMGLHGVTTSPWAAKKLSTLYNMKLDTIELAVTQGEYGLHNTGARKKILFYARPVTPRRGFELGALALEIFNVQHPEYEINFIGWDTERYNIPFPYVNNKILNQTELNELYNQCAAGLALSFTSMSLLPVEMMAAGCVPVVNDADYTRAVGYAEGIEYAVPSPQAIADTISKIVEETEATTAKRAQALSEFSKRFTWQATDKMFDAIIEKTIFTTK